MSAADGTTDFSVLQNELKGRSTKIVMVAFDLLYFNGYDLRKLPLFQSKELLKKLIAGTAIQFSESFEIDGKEMYQHACRTGLEGVVSKVRDSKYPSGRSNDWVKKTCAQRGTLAFAGFALDGNKWDGLYIGRRKGKDLIYVGKVDHGFDSASAKMLPRPPYAADPKDATLHKTDCASRYLGRTRTTGRDRISREVSRGQSAASLLQGPAGRFVMLALTAGRLRASRPLAAANGHCLRSRGSCSVHSHQLGTNDE